MAPEPPGPRVFSRAIRSTPLPNPFRPPTSIAKYNGETKPELWLADFRLACQLGGARGDDRAIIRQLPLFLSDTARRWLEELPANQIHNWVDLVRVFEGNFKGTYIRPGNSWDLSKCKQKSGETLREYARRFSKQRTELPHIPDHDVILAFVSGTTSRDLVRELGRNRPQTVDELMDVVANYAAGEEAVGAFFSSEGRKGKQPVDGSRNSQPIRFTTGLTWSESSRVTSKGPIYGQGTRGTSANASRRQERLFGSTLDASRSSALSCHTSPTTTSSWRLSRAPPVETWCGN